MSFGSSSLPVTHTRDISSSCSRGASRTLGTPVARCASDQTSVIILQVLHLNMSLLNHTLTTLQCRETRSTDSLRVSRDPPFSEAFPPPPLSSISTTPAQQHYHHPRVPCSARAHYHLCHPPRCCTQELNGFNERAGGLLVDSILSVALFRGIYSFIIVVILRLAATIVMFLPL